MGRPKKIKPVLGTVTVTKMPILRVSEPVIIPEEQITPLSIDYSHEYLNDMARKINQIIDKLNAV